MVAGKSFFFSKIGVQSCVRFRCTLLHSYFALHTLLLSLPNIINEVPLSYLTKRTKSHQATWSIFNKFTQLFAIPSMNPATTMSPIPIKTKTRSFVVFSSFNR